MTRDYVVKRNGGYYIVNSRVSLDSVACAFLREESPEAIAQAFPALSREQIFGALAFYLANRENMDRYLRESQREFESAREQARQNNPALYAKLGEARRKMHVPGA